MCSPAATADPETGTYVLGIMLFQHAFTFLEFGYASALAWVMFAILLVLTVLQLRLTATEVAGDCDVVS